MTEWLPRVASATGRWRRHKVMSRRVWATRSGASTLHDGGTLSEQAPGPGWWQASDGNWYSPETRPALPSSAGQSATATAFSGADCIQPPPGMGLIPGTDLVRPLVPDSGFVHLLRFLLVDVAMSLLCYLLVGVIWLMFAMSSTGRRKRDILMLVVPIWGTVVWTQTLWRYTAKNVYWSARVDRPSRSLFAK